MNDCLFCKIAQGTIPSKKIAASDTLYAFYDIKPQAPIHALIIPREHIATLNDINPNHQNLLGEMLLCAKQIARDLNLAENGYRLVFNCGRNGGQEVYHIHLHLLGGRPFSWPPG